MLLSGNRYRSSCWRPLETTTECCHIIPFFPGGLDNQTTLKFLQRMRDILQELGGKLASPEIDWWGTHAPVETLNGDMCYIFDCCSAGSVVIHNDLKINFASTDSRLFQSPRPSLSLKHWLTRYKIWMRDLRRSLVFTPDCFAIIRKYSV